MGGGFLYPAGCPRARRSAEEHLPGARLVPMAALPDSLKELDPEKPVLVY